MRYALLGNTGRPIHSARNLQRKFNRQHRRMTMLHVWRQVFCPEKEPVVGFTVEA